MRRLAVLAALLVAGPVRADDSPDDGALVPRHAVARRVGRTVQIEAQYELDVDGPQPRGTVFQIPLPHRAVITAGTVQAAGHTQRLHLETATAVTSRFDAIYARPGRGTARSWAVRVDATGDSASVEVAAPHAAHVELALSLEVPGCFANDVRAIIIPPAWRRVVRGGDLVTGAAIATCDNTVAADDTQWLTFPAPELAHRPGGEQRIGIIASRLPLPTQDLSRIEISLARELTEIPADLHTVLVVDHSRSLTTAELETQRAIVAGYLLAAPHSRIQLVGYARYARALLPGWMPAERAASRIDRELRALAPRNGSNVGAGIATAAALLAHTSGTRRIIVLADERMAERTVDERASYTTGLPADTVINVVALGSTSDRLARYDDGVLAPLARATEGISMTGGVDEHGRIDALPLVRPVSLDNLSITTPGWTALGSGDPVCVEGSDEFREGTSCAWLGSGRPDSGQLVIDGYLWGHKVTRALTPDPRDALSLARLLSAVDDLPQDLVAPIQEAAVAINSAWSLVAIWGAAGGYGDLEPLDTFGSGTWNGRSHDTIGSVSTIASVYSDLEALLRAQLAAAVRACKPQGAVVATIELTDVEIADVSIEVHDAADITLDTCIADGIWDVSLSLPDPPSHTTVHLVFPAP